MPQTTQAGQSPETRLTTTTRIHILSDLHLEVDDATWQPPPIEADIVVLAGDTHRGTAGIDWAARGFPDSLVLYLPGNHEFYGGEYHEVLQALKAAADHHPNLYLLDRTELHLGGIRFLGCTLWTDFALLGSPESAMLASRDQMNDFQAISLREAHGSTRLLTPQDTLGFHNTDLAWLTDRLRQQAPLPTVVITHHGPSLRCVPPRFWRDPLSGAFASSLDEMVATSGAHLWVSGHTHHVVDDLIGATRLISNPRGYAGYESVPGFRPELVVEVPQAGESHLP